MARLTRAQQQERTRSAVLAAAVEEFAEHGYAAAKVDRIAARAELTRGAVYSNFPSKRALYLAVLLDSVPRPAAPAATVSAAPAATVPTAAPAATVPTAATEALDVAAGAEAFARVWLERLPMSADPAAAGKLKAQTLTGVFDDEPGRTAMAGLTELEGLLLALALESCRARGAGRRVRLAQLILTLLNGASQLAQAAPGFGDPFDVVRACRHLAGLDTGDRWDPAHLPYVAAAQRRREPWTPPVGLTDALTGHPARLDGDGLVVVLGTGRLRAAEEAVRTVRPGDLVTVALVTEDPAESGALVRLRITELAARLRQVFGPVFRPSLHLILDDEAVLASAIGAPIDEDSEAAVYVRSGEIVARAQGRGAAYAAATGSALAEPQRETDRR